MPYNDKLLKLKTMLKGPLSRRVTSYFEPALVDVVDAYGDSVGLKRAGAIRRATILGLQQDGVNVSGD